MASNPTRDSIERALEFAVTEGLIRSWKRLNMHLAGRDYGQAKWEVEMHPSVHSADGLGTYPIRTYQEGKLLCAALASARAGLHAKAGDSEALDKLASLLQGNDRIDDEALIAAFYDIVGLSGRITDPFGPDEEES